MMGSYQLTFKDEWVPLFELDFDYLNEELALIDLEYQWKRQRNLKAEDIIRNLYSFESGRTDSLSCPIQLLKLLLTKDFNLAIITSNNDRSQLSKSFYPIQFLAINQIETIAIGDYYKCIETFETIEQLKSYSHWQDDICGVKGLNAELIQAYLSSGYTVAVKDALQTRAIFRPKK